MPKTLVKYAEASRRRGVRAGARARHLGVVGYFNTMDRGDIVEQRCIKCSNMRPRSRYRGEPGCIDDGNTECNDCGGRK